MDEPAGDVLGRPGVTGREAEVLDALAERLTNSEIAARLGVSERTVESHVSSLLRKLGVHNRVDLARRGVSRRAMTSAARSVPAPARGDRPQGMCVGRDEELHRLLACRERAADGTVVAVIRGEAGIGKSRLAAAVAAAVHQRGGRVALGSCTDGRQRPYEPFAALLTIEGRARVGADLVIDPERDRVAVQAAVHEHLLEAARVHPTLFVIEDLHWASSATRDVVSHIARVGGDAPLMLLITFRDEPQLDGGDVGDFLARLASLPTVEFVTLSGLDATAAASVIHAVGGDLDPEFAVWQTGGNPLFLRELARDGEGSRSLREIVAARFGRFSSADLEVLDAATVAGEQIDVSLVASTVDRSVDEVLDTLERAETAGLIGPGARPGRFAFTHDVFRSVRYASLPSSRRMRLHAAIARALDRRATDDRDIAERARHACLGGPRFDPAWAADLARRAGDAAFDATDYSEAAEHHRRALGSLDLLSDDLDDVRLEASIRLGSSLVLMGDPEGLTMLHTAARAAQSSRNPLALARALCSMTPLPGASPTTSVPDPVFRSLAETALGWLPPSEATWRIRMLALLGSHLADTDDPEQGAAMVREAVAAARQLDDATTVGRALLSQRFRGGPLELDERLECGSELVELGDRLNVEVFSSVGRQQLWWCYRELGEREQADHWYAEAAERMPLPDLEQLSYPPSVALLDGDLRRADHLTNVLSDANGDTPLGRGYAAVLRMAIANHRGRLPDPEFLERMLASNIWFSELVKGLLGRSLARSGRLADARQLLDSARRDGFSAGYAARGGALSATCWAEVAAIAADAGAARDLEAVFERLAGRFVDDGLSVWDTVDRVRALLRLTIGDALGRPRSRPERSWPAVGVGRRSSSPESSSSSPRHSNTWVSTTPTIWSPRRSRSHGAPQPD